MPSDGSESLRGRPVPVSGASGRPGVLRPSGAPLPCPGQFYSVMAFLDRLGYHVANRDGDWAFYGGHAQDALAKLYAEERR